MTLSAFGSTEEAVCAGTSTLASAGSGGRITAAEGA
jgi:hypothetical protein